MAVTSNDRGDHPAPVLEGRESTAVTEGLQSSAALTAPENNLAISQMQTGTNEAALHALGNGFALTDDSATGAKDAKVVLASQTEPTYDPPPPESVAYKQTEPTYDPPPPENAAYRKPPSNEGQIILASSDDPPPTYEQPPPQEA